MGTYGRSMPGWGSIVTLGIVVAWLLRTSESLAGRTLGGLFALTALALAVQRLRRSTEPRESKKLWLVRCDSALTGGQRRLYATVVTPDGAEKVLAGAETLAPDTPELPPGWVAVEAGTRTGSVYRMTALPDHPDPKPAVSSHVHQFRTAAGARARTVAGLIFLVLLTIALLSPVGFALQSQDPLRTKLLTIAFTAPFWLFGLWLLTRVRRGAAEAAWDLTSPPKGLNGVLLDCVSSKGEWVKPARETPLTVTLLVNGEKLTLTSDHSFAWQEFIGRRVMLKVLPGSNQVLTAQVE